MINLVIFALGFVSGILCVYALYLLVDKYDL